VTYIIDMHKDIEKYAGPDHWNDFDMMEVGHGMSVNEDRAHFTMWCMLASPLIAGNDLRSMSAETVSILTNKDVIEIDQDKKGEQAYLLEQRDSVDTWVRHLANGDVAVCFLNRSRKPVTLKRSRASPGDNGPKNGKPYGIWDVWNRKKVMDMTAALSSTIPPHDVLLLRFRP
jgi:alpha-galactosidase